MLVKGAMTNEILLQVEGLSRYYGQNQAVSAVSFQLSRGQILGFLGPNGAGKSTTLRMVAGVLAPDSGRITIHNTDLLDQPRRAKQFIGYLPEQPPLYRELTVDEQLCYSARLHGIDSGARCRAITKSKERCGLTEVGQRLIGNLSKGYQQRVGIAQAILHDPPIIILDEPTVGLDPIQGQEIRALIRELGQDHGVILSTHLLSEVQATCTHVQIMQNGRLVYTGALADMCQQQPFNWIRIGLTAPPLIAELATLPAVIRVDDLGGGQFRLHYPTGIAPHRALIEQACASGWDLWEITPEPIGLEQIFVDLMLKRERSE